MVEITLEGNPKTSLQVLKVGHEQTPVVQIDNFSTDTAGLIDFGASGVAYGPDGTGYPGVRSMLPKSYVRAVLGRIYRLLFQVYAIPTQLGLRPVNTVYSLISTPESKLSPAQCVPHFDSYGPYYLAILHYLSPGSFCGTGLFRHRPTGFEKILDSRREAFYAASKAFEDQNGPPPQKYINGSNDHFELYEQIEYRPNRLVVYPGCLLHSGLVDPAVDIDPDPRTGRLTANIFADFS